MVPLITCTLPYIVPTHVLCLTCPGVTCLSLEVYLSQPSLYPFFMSHVSYSYSIPSIHPSHPFIFMFHLFAPHHLMFYVSTSILHTGVLCSSLEAHPSIHPPISSIYIYVLSVYPLIVSFNFPSLYPSTHPIPPACLLHVHDALRSPSSVPPTKIRKETNTVFFLIFKGVRWINLCLT